jgi:hypothetical protein
VSDELFSLPGDKQNSDERLWLADVLTSAAAQERPAFSEQLHARIMDAIRRDQPRRTLATVCATASQPVEPASAEPLVAVASAAVSSAPHSKRHAAKTWLAAAAALLLLAGGAWRLASLGSSSGTTGNPPPPADAYTWADLDHDARLSSQLVADQTPFEAPVEELALSGAK